MKPVDAIRRKKRAELIVELRRDAAPWLRKMLAAYDSDDPDLADKILAYQASVDWERRGYLNPQISFEAGAAWQRNRHKPLCECGETVPGPCIARYPEGHNARKCAL